MPKYRASEYLRLSYSDDKNNESDSVANQKRLIADYLSGHPELERQIAEGRMRIELDVFEAPYDSLVIAEVEA